MKRAAKPTIRPIALVRTALWALVALAAIGVLVWAADSRTSSARPIGGPFTLVDQNGATVTEAALKGHPSLIFFGYTFCPDVCPTTLLSASNWLKALGPDGDRLKVFFVTVDPERDTAAQLKAYLSAFDPRITGLTGPRSALDPMLKSYLVYSKKVGSGDDYAMDHTASLYLLDAKGDLAGTLDYQADEATALAKLKTLIAG